MSEQDDSLSDLRRPSSSTTGERSSEFFRRGEGGTLSFLNLSKSLGSSSSRFRTNALNRSKLDWAAQRVQGRGTELERLTKAAACDSNINICFVTGAAGTGKTALVEQAFGDYDITDWFVSVKYDQMCPSECSSTTIKIFSQLCETIADIAPTKTVDRIAQDLKRELGTTYIADLILSAPGVAKLFSDADDATDDTSTVSNKCSLDLLNSMLRTLLQCITRHLEDAPIVLFFDDIHWSDDVGFQLLDFLLSSDDIHNVLIVATYRHDDNDNNGNDNDDGTTISSGAAAAAAFDAQQTEKHPHCVTKIEVKKLTPLDVANILKGLTKSRNIQDVQPLATVIHKRTDGIAFFVVEFIKTLEKKKLLQFSSDSFRYEWDLEQIKADTVVCTNIVELVSVKLEMIPPEVARIIMVSSILGPNFLVDVLAAVVCSTSTDGVVNTTMDTILDALEYAQTQGFMEPIESRAGLRYKFVHDYLQKMAYDLVQDHEKADLHWQVGWALFMTRDRSDSHKFLAVEHLNKAVQMGATNSLRPAGLAKLNLVTANEARANYAFVPARDYLKTAMEILEPENPWVEYYDMMLEVTTLLVKLHIGLGNFEGAKELIDVCTQKARSDIDVFPFSIALVTVLQSQYRPAEGVEVGVKALGTLGCKMKAHIAKPVFVLKVLRMRSRLKKLSNEDILALPDMPESHTARLIIGGMSILYISMYQLGRHEEAFYISLKLIELQLKHGLASADCFAVWGYACLALNDRDEAYRFGELGLQLHDRCSSESSFAVFYFKNAWLHALRHPLHDTIEPLWSAYNLGFMTGLDPIYAAAAGHIYAIYSFHCGVCLLTLHSTHKKILAEMKRYEQDVVCEVSNIVLQTIENFLGKGHSDDVTVLDGNAMNETQRLSVKPVDQWQVTNRILFILHKVILSVYFGRDCSNTMKEFYKISKSQMKGQGFLPVPWAMYVALAALRLAKAGGKKKRLHLKKVRGIIKELESASKNGDVNAHVMNQLILAELAVVKKEPADTIKTKYDVSIALARRSGFVNIGGLGNAMLAEYYLEVADKDWSDFYSRQAIRLYQQWSSETLVKDMEHKFGVKRGKRFSIFEEGSDWSSDDMALHSSNFLDAHSGDVIRRVSVADEGKITDDSSRTSSSMFMVSCESDPVIPPFDDYSSGEFVRRLSVTSGNNGRGNNNKPPMDDDDDATKGSTSSSTFAMSCESKTLHPPRENIIRLNQVH